MEEHKMEELMLEPWALKIHTCVFFPSVDRELALLRMVQPA
jgi:hypothetical protein